MELICYRMKNRHKVQVRMRTIPSVQHCVTKKGIGSMMVLRSYLTTIRNSVTVMAATIHACWPNFLWNFLESKWYIRFTYYKTEKKPLQTIQILNSIAVYLQITSKMEGRIERIEQFHPINEHSILKASNHYLSDMQINFPLDSDINESAACVRLKELFTQKYCFFCEKFALRLS